MSCSNSLQRDQKLTKVLVGPSRPLVVALAAYLLGTVDGLFQAVIGQESRISPHFLILLLVLLHVVEFIVSLGK